MLGPSKAQSSGRAASQDWSGGNFAMHFRSGQLERGYVIGGYRIDELISRGGMGAVYRATNLALNRIYALKVIAPELAGDDQFRERFKREMRIAASLHHPNVVGIHYAGEQDDLLFLVMDFVYGTDLRQLVLKDGALDPERAVDLLTQVASSLDAAHHKGLVHRDVKPGNILITVRDGEEHAYLTDFGLAKRSGTVGSLTQAGAVVGTVDYMAPEQVTGGSTDARTDIYALGCVFFQMLTGNVPYERENSVATLFAHVHEPPPPVEAPVTETYPALGPVVEKAMAKEPADRYASAGDFARDAGAALRGSRYTGPPSLVATGEAKPADDETAPPGFATPAGTEIERGADEPTGWPTAEPQPTAPPIAEPQPTAPPIEEPQPTAPPSAEPEPASSSETRASPGAEPQPTASPSAEPQPTASPSAEPQREPEPASSSETRASPSFEPRDADSPEPEGWPTTGPEAAPPTRVGEPTSEPAVAAAAAAAAAGPAPASASPAQGGAGITSGPPPAPPSGPPREPGSGSPGGGVRKYRWPALAALLVAAAIVVAVVVGTSGSSPKSSTTPGSGASASTSAAGKGSTASPGLQLAAATSPVPTNHVTGTGTASLVLKGDVATVRVSTVGLLNGSPHLMHIHAGGEGLCPPASAARLHNGHLAISTGNGIKYYGPPLVSLTLRGDTSSKSNLAFPRYPATGAITYERVVRLPSVVAKLIRANNGVVVIHGIDYDNSGTYDEVLGPSDLAPQFTGDSTAPALCGHLVASQTTPSTSSSDYKIPGHQSSQQPIASVQPSQHTVYSASLSRVDLAGTSEGGFAFLCQLAGLVPGTGGVSPVAGAT
jgi:serine/threonine protein kinase